MSEHCLALDILYQDAWLVAINKPSGLLVHRSPIDNKETQFVIQRLREQLNQYVYPVHRLDKPTSGVLILAFDRQTARALSQQWTNVSKVYHAICRGLAPDEQLIDHPITTKAERGDTFSKPKVQTAQTLIKRLHSTTLAIGFGKQAAQYPITTFSMLEARPQTGRKHQIRKHLKHINHPIVGDTQYGKGDINRYFRQHYDVKRLLLHCHFIGLQHPISGQIINIYAPHDYTWQRVLSALFSVKNLSSVIC